MAQIKTGTGMTKPKSINVFYGGTWVRQRVGKVFHNGLWKDLMQYILSLYNLGVETVPFSMGYRSSSFCKYEERTDNILLTPTFDTTTETIAATTTNAVDLTGINTIYCDITLATNTTAALFATVTRNAHPQYAGGTQTSAGYVPNNQVPVPNKVTALNVSALSGMFYVGVLAGPAASAGNYGTVIVHRIWME